MIHKNDHALSLQKSLLTEKLKSLRKLLRQKTLQHNKTNSLHGPVNLIDLYLEAKKEGTDISGTLSPRSTLACTDGRGAVEWMDGW